MKKNLDFYRDLFRLRATTRRQKLERTLRSRADKGVIPRGTCSELAKKHKVSISYVYRVAKELDLRVRKKLEEEA